MIVELQRTGGPYIQAHRTSRGKCERFPKMGSRLCSRSNVIAKETTQGAALLVVDDEGRKEGRGGLVWSGNARDQWLAKGRWIKGRGVPTPTGQGDNGLRL